MICNLDAAIAKVAELIEISRREDLRVTLCVVRRHAGVYDVVPLAAAKTVLGYHYLCDFKRIEYVAVTGHEPRC